MKYTLETYNKKKMVLMPRIGDFDEIVADIERHTFDRLYTQYNQAIRNNVISFGKFQLSKSQLIYKNKTIYLMEIEKVSVSDDKIIIKKRDQFLPWAKESYSKTPNAHIFIKLINQFIHHS